MAELVPVTEADFAEQVLKKEKLVVVDFGATWCAPCKKLHPLLEELLDEFEGEVEGAYVDVGANPALARQYGVISVPQTHLFKAGEHLDQVVGLSKRDKYKQLIEQYK
ncbi:MAG: thioredoxin fold domain-containing protein [Candidatus Delongbacteria bacterium]|nr:thioredoxin fold domain-containing protein [Candidatus Delongbacteria bacterium]